MKTSIYTPPASRLRLLSRLTIVALLPLAGCVSNSTPVPPALTTPTIAWAPQATVPFGTKLGAGQLDATSSTAGTFSYSPAAGTVVGAGTNTLTTIFTPADSSKYAQASATTTITVTQATPVITFVPAAANTGVGITPAQLDATATDIAGQTLPGTFVYTPALGVAFAAGTQTLSVTFTPTDTADYAVVTKTATLTVGTPAPTYTYNNVAIVGGGFITGIVAYPGSTNKAPLRYARTDVGGAYRSTAVVTASANPNTWVPITDQFARNQAGYQGIESIGIDPSDPTKLYLAVGMYAESFGSNGAFLVSGDQGNTYKVVPVNFKMGSNDAGRYAGERLAVDPNLGTKLYFGSRLNGLQTSIDGGLTWNQVASFPVKATTSGVGVVFVDFVASSGGQGSATPVIYVGVSDTGVSTTGYQSLYRSIDAGVTWQAIPGQPTGFYPSHGVFGPDGALYLSYGDQVGPNNVLAGALYQYTPPMATSPGGPGTFVNITPTGSARPAGTQGGFGSITVDPTNKGVLMATTMDDYYPIGASQAPGPIADDIYRSRDYGKSWVSLDLLSKKMDTSISPWVQTIENGGTGNWPGSIVIDPYNSNHVSYGNGQTLFDSVNIQNADGNTSAPSFQIGAQGIEETVVLALSSPNNNNGATSPLLFSGVGDITGFSHTSTTVSPAGGIVKPVFGNTSSIDFAEAKPTIVARVGSGGGFGAFSTNSGAAYTAFPTLPAGTTSGNGQIAVAADGSSIVWANNDSAVAYTTNNGTTWTASAGATAKSGVVADRLDPLTFYILSGTTLQASTDGGKTFTAINNNVPRGTLNASFAAKGDLWISANSGLFHSTNGGLAFTQIPGFTADYATGFGKSAGMQYFGTNFPAVFTVAVGAQGYGFYRSIDGGTTWILINDATHEYGYVGLITGDPKTFGRVYIGTGGRGVIYGDSPF